jgi:Protein of unknown function (DUF4199)
MKKTIVKYSAYGVIMGFIIFALMLFVGKGLDYKTQEVLGYASIIVSLSFVYFAIKHYRDKVNNGLITFWKAAVIGLSVSAFVGIGVAISDYLYTAFINPDFMAEYMDYTLKGMKDTLSDAEFETQKALLDEQIKIWGNPIYMALFMFLTVFVIGFVISLISSLMLQRKS